MLTETPDTVVSYDNLGTLVGATDLGNNTPIKALYTRSFEILGRKSGTLGYYYDSAIHGAYNGQDKKYDNRPSQILEQTISQSSEFNRGFASLKAMHLALTLSDAANPAVSDFVTEHLTKLSEQQKQALATSIILNDIGKSPEFMAIANKIRTAQELEETQDHDQAFEIVVDAIAAIGTDHAVDAELLEDSRLLTLKDLKEKKPDVFRLFRGVVKLNAINAPSFAQGETPLSDLELFAQKLEELKELGYEKGEVDTIIKMANAESWLDILGANGHKQDINLNLAHFSAPAFSRMTKAMLKINEAVFNEIAEEQEQTRNTRIKEAAKHEAFSYLFDTAQAKLNTLDTEAQTKMFPFLGITDGAEFDLETFKKNPEQLAKVRLWAHNRHGNNKNLIAAWELLPETTQATLINKLGAVEVNGTEAAVWEQYSPNQLRLTTDKSPQWGAFGMSVYACILGAMSVEGVERPDNVMFDGLAISGILAKMSESTDPTVDLGSKKFTTALGSFKALLFDDNGKARTGITKALLEKSLDMLSKGQDIKLLASNTNEIKADDIVTTLESQFKKKLDTSKVPYSIDETGAIVIEQQSKLGKLFTSITATPIIMDCPVKVKGNGNSTQEETYKSGSKITNAGTGLHIESSNGLDAKHRSNSNASVKYR